jgi:hypothetical protein
MRFQCNICSPNGGAVLASLEGVRPTAYQVPVVAKQTVTGTTPKKVAKGVLIPFWSLMGQITDKSDDANMAFKVHVSKVKVGTETYAVEVGTFVNTKPIEAGDRLLLLQGSIARALETGATPEPAPKRPRVAAGPAKGRAPAGGAKGGKGAIVAKGGKGGANVAKGVKGGKGGAKGKRGR